MMSRPVPTFDPGPLVNFRAVPEFNPTAPAAAAQLMANVGNTMARVVDQAGRLYTANKAFEAQQAGFEAGASKDFGKEQIDQLPLPNTLAGEAYRNAALESFNNRTVMEMQNGIAQQQTAYWSLPETERNPETYIQGLAEQTFKPLEGLPENVAQPLRQMATQQIQSEAFRAQVQNAKFVEQRTAADNEANLELLSSQWLARPVAVSEADKKTEALMQAGIISQMNALHLPEAKQALIMAELDAKRNKALMEQKNTALKAWIQDMNPDKLELMAKIIETKPVKEWHTLMGMQTPFTYEQADVIETKVKAEIQDRQHFENRDYEVDTVNEQLAKTANYVSLKEGVETLSVSAGDVQASFMAGHITKNEMEGLLSNLSSERVKQEKRYARIREVMTTGVGTPEEVDEALSYLDSGEGATAHPVPGYQVGSGYGVVRANGMRHKGVDIPVPMGKSVGAYMAGRVTAVKNEPGGYGQWVEIDHGQGIKTRYGHLSKQTVEVGDTVGAGQSIGLSGNTGRSTGPHLHFEVLQHGKQIDPSGKLANAGKAPDWMANAQRFGRISSVRSKMLTTALNSKDPRQAVATAAIIDKLIDKGVDTGLKSSHEAFALALHNNMKMFGDSARAVDYTTKRLDPANGGLFDEIGLEKKGGMKKNSQLMTAWTSFRDELLGKASNSITSLPAIKNEFTTLYASALLGTGGDVEAANKKAKADFYKTWSVSHVSGKPQWMKYAPEKFYGVKFLSDQDNATWIKKQAIAENSNKIREKALDYNLVFYSLDSKQRPAYRVMYKNNDGLLKPVIGSDGNPVVFIPDVKGGAEINKRHAANHSKNLAYGALPAGAKLLGRALNNISRSR